MFIPKSVIDAVLGEQTLSELEEPTYENGRLDSVEQLEAIGKLDHTRLDRLGDGFWSDPLALLIMKEEAQGGPIALCKDSTY